MPLSSFKIESLLAVFITTICIIVFIEIEESFGQNESEYFAHYDSYVMNKRNPPHPIHPLLLSRISAHQMTGEDISDDELFSLFEAARWSPSNYNIQPWNFVYAKRNTQRWQQFFNLLVPSNQLFCNNSAVLMITVSNVYEIHKGNKIMNEWNSFDTSAACLSLSLEASSRGFAVHEMGGFNVTAAAILLDIHDNSDYAIEVMIAVGRRPNAGQTSNNETITGRIPVESFVSEDLFKRRQIIDIH